MAKTGSGFKIPPCSWSALQKKSSKLFQSDIFQTPERCLNCRKIPFIFSHLISSFNIPILWSKLPSENLWPKKKEIPINKNQQYYQGDVQGRKLFHSIQPLKTFKHTQVRQTYVFYTGILLAWVLQIQVVSQFAMKTEIYSICAPR